MDGEWEDAGMPITIRHSKCTLGHVLRLSTCPGQSRATALAWLHSCILPFNTPGIKFFLLYAQVNFAVCLLKSKSKNNKKLVLINQLWMWQSVKQTRVVGALIWMGPLRYIGIPHIFPLKNFSYMPKGNTVGSIIPSSDA